MGTAAYRRDANFENVVDVVILLADIRERSSRLPSSMVLRIKQFRSTKQNVLSGAPER